MIQLGVASTRLTPTPGETSLAGYADRLSPNTGHYSDIEISAVALHQEDSTGILLSADIVFFDRHLTRRIKEILYSKAGLTRDQIWLGATHTHTGPHVLVTADLFGDVNPKYLNAFIDTCVDVALKALAELAPATLEARFGTSDIGINRRSITPEATVVFRPNPDGPVDRRLDCLVCRRDDNHIAAIIFSFGCHLTLMDRLEVGADFIGFARDRIRQQTGAEAVLFVNSAAGDIKPDYIDETGFKKGSLAVARQYGQRMAKDVLETLETPFAHTVSGSFSTVLQTVTLPFETSRIPTHHELKKILAAPLPEGIKIDDDSEDLLQKQKRIQAILKQFEKKWAQHLLDDLDAGRELKTGVEMDLQIWRFSNLTMIGLAAELCAGVALKIRTLLKDQPHWLAGYSNAVVGYVPAKKDTPFGGYEVDGSFYYYYYPAPFVSEADQIILKHLENSLLDSAIQL